MTKTMTNTNRHRMTLTLLALATLAPACRTNGDDQGAIPYPAPTAGTRVAGAPGAVDVDDRAQLVARGERLVTLGGCHDCHTPVMMGPNGPAPDRARALSGHPSSVVMPPAPKLPEGPWVAVVGATMTAWNGPWGTSFTANLTPDRETGLGAWSPADFIATIRTRRHLGKGRPILPPMPMDVLNEYTDGELAAIFAYLQSLPPIHNKVPAPIEPEPPRSAAADARDGAAVTATN
jgi:mono/diheme cytochrome c family protein